VTPTPLADDFYDDHGLGPLFPHWQEALPLAVLFGVVLYVLGWVLIPRAVRQLEARGEAIEGGIEKAEQIQARATKQLTEYRAALAEARHDAARAREEAREQGTQLIAEARERAQAAARRLVEEAQAQIQADRERAFAQLRPEIGRLSIELASKVTGESLVDEAERRATVARFLSEL
jgi:F-type H+-transporting ATPase subunit b